VGIRRFAVLTLQEHAMMRFVWAIGVLALVALPCPPAAAADNELTPAEKAEGFKLLFNGKDLTGWSRNSAGFGGWSASEGAIKLAKGGGMLYADGEFDNFVLKVDFMMAKGCNSGVFIRTGNKKDEVQTGIEVQVQDDFGKKPNRNSCGSLYDLVAPKSMPLKPAGEWNTYVITCNKNLITVEMNGEKITEINLDEWDKPGLRPDGSKHKFKMAMKDFPRKGFIGFQDHGNEVAYKNIKIKELK
jgi:hypothetical protein